MRDFLFEHIITKYYPNSTQQTILPSELFSLCTYEMQEKYIKLIPDDATFIPTIDYSFLNPSSHLRLIEKRYLHKLDNQELVLSFYLCYKNIITNDQKIRLAACLTIHDISYLKHTNNLLPIWEWLTPEISQHNISLDIIAIIFDIMIITHDSIPPFSLEQTTLAKRFLKISTVEQQLEILDFISAHQSQALILLWLNVDTCYRNLNITMLIKLFEICCPSKFNKKEYEIFFNHCKKPQDILILMDLQISTISIEYIQKNKNLHLLKDIQDCMLLSINMCKVRLPETTLSWYSKFYAINSILTDDNNSIAIKQFLDLCNPYEKNLIKNYHLS